MRCGRLDCYVDVPHEHRTLTPGICNSDMSITWPQPTEGEDVKRVSLGEEEVAYKRQRVDQFMEAQHARRTMWRKRRGWETP